MIGERFGRYEVLAKLGEGGMGTVWRARDTVLGRDVALKLLPHGTTQSDEATKRLFREAQTASHLDHPSIATVYDVGEIEGQSFVTFALVDGETVSDRCASGPLEVELALRLAHQGAEALAHAHEQGVLHRDVTGRNAMINRAGRLVLVDFGLARAQDHTRTTLGAAPLGTASYVAPEVAKGGVADERSDVYGLGVVLYEMLTGTLPFRGERLEALLYAAAHEEPDPPSARRTDLSADIDALVLKALAKNPDERFQTVAKFASAIDAVLYGSPPSSSHGHPRIVRLGHGATRRVALALVAIVVATTGLYLLRGHSEPSAAYESSAVLPFLVRGDNPEEDRLWADGLCENIASKLTQITKLRIAPWITSSHYSTDGKDLSELAKELNVDTLLLGTYERIDSRIRGYVDLVETDSGLKIWTHEFDEPFDDFLKLQSRLALQVAQSLKGRLSGEERQQLERPVSRSLEAYEFYRLGALELQKETRAANALAIDYFEKAIDMDPELAEAHNGLGAAYHQRSWRYWEGGARNDELARACFQRALDLNPGLLAGRRGLIVVGLTTGRWKECFEQAQLVAATGRRDAESFFVQGLGYFVGGLPTLGIRYLREALELDPANQGALFNLVGACWWARQYEAAIEAGQTYLGRFPDEHEVRLWMANSLHRLGRLRQARGQYERALTLAGRNPNIGLHQTMAHFYFDLGDSARAREVLQEGIALYRERLRTFPETTLTYRWLAVLYAMLGDREAFEQCMQVPVDEADWWSQYRSHAYLGDHETARQVLRDMWSRGLFSEIQTTEMLPMPTTYGQIPGLEPLAQEAEEQLQLLLRQYTPANMRDGSHPVTLW